MKIHAAILESPSIYGMARLNYVSWIPAERWNDWRENRLAVRDELVVSFEYLFHGNGD